MQEELNIFQKLKKINTFIFDVDGVLTDGSVLVNENGELLRAFNIKDGYALQIALKNGFNVCIISGGKGKSMEKRFENLGISDVFLGVGDKVAVFEQYLEDRNVAPDEVLYMGDDIPDLQVMNRVGIAACPSDAVEELKTIAHYISPNAGGKAAARDVIEKVLKVQEKWLSNKPTAAEASK